MSLRTDALLGRAVPFTSGILRFASVFSIAARQLLRMTGDGVRRAVAHSMSRLEAHRHRYWPTSLFNVLDLDP
jgi:hypothetical protein